MFEVSLVGDRELIARLGSISDRILNELERTIRALMINLRSKVMTENLSGPTGAHTLSVRTGNLRRSVIQNTVRDAEGVTGTVSYGATVPYARIHELGGTIHIPEIHATNARALHFTWQGREVFFTKVAAHDVHMPMRAPLRTAFENYLPTIKAQLNAAVERGLRAS